MNRFFLLCLALAFLCFAGLSSLFLFTVSAEDPSPESMEELLESTFGREMLEAFESLGEDDLEGMENLNFSGDNCFDYYKFGSVQVNVYTDKNVVFLGDEVIFSGELENENPYPVFNGYLYARISEQNPNYLTDGHNVIDEFIALGPLAINSESTLPVSFSWKVPDKLSFGEYTIEYFFSVNKKMNLAGLPFTNEIIAGSSDFLVSGNVEGRVSFLKDTTQVNGKKYDHIGNWPLINSGEKVTVSQDLRNSFSEEVKTTISYNLYYWDSLDPNDGLSSTSEEIALKPGETKTLFYEIPRVEKSVYYLQIVSESDNGVRSIVNVRITSDVSQPRINYFGLNNFPINSNDSVTLYSCFHNTSLGPAKLGRSLLVAKDRLGEELARVDYKGIILGEISSKFVEFVANSDLDYVLLEQELYDENGDLLESQEIIYDISLLGLESEREIDGDTGVVESFWDKYLLPIIIISGLILISVVIFTIYFVLAKPSFKFRKTKTSDVVVCLFLFLALFCSSVEASNAQSTINNFKKQQSRVESKPFETTFTRWAVMRARGWNVGDWTSYLVPIYYHLTPNRVSGGASYQYVITTTAIRSLLPIGAEVDFCYRSVGTYHLAGVTYDTPYLGQEIQLHGKQTMRMDAKKWVGSATNSGRFCPYILDWYGNLNATPPSSCVGGTVDCPTDFSYDWQHQGNIPWYTEYLKKFSNEAFTPLFPVAGDHRPGYTQVEDIPRPLHTLSSDNSVIDCSNPDELCKAVGPGTATLTPGISSSHVILSYACPIPFRNVDLQFSGFRPTWEFEVRDIDIEEPLCGSFHQNEYSSADTTWPEIGETSFCAQGEFRDDVLLQPQYPAIGSSTEWKCFGEDGSHVLCEAKRLEASSIPQCGTYHRRNYPAQVEGCAINVAAYGEAWGYRWPDVCWELHPSRGAGSFCEAPAYPVVSNAPNLLLQTNLPEFPYPVPPPGNKTRWYCSDGENVSSEECYATRGLAKPWIATRGGLVHVGGDLGLDMRSLLYSDVLSSPFGDDKTSISSELLTSLGSLHPGGDDRRELFYGFTDHLYTLGDYTKQISNSWYERLLSRAQLRDPHEVNWSILEVGAIPDCETRAHIYFVPENLEVDPEIYKNFGSDSDTNGCIFIVKGDVNIGEGIFKSNDGIDYDIVRGFFVVDGKVTIEKDSQEVEVFLYRDGLKIVGGLFATGGGTSIALERDLGMHNLDYPALVIFHDAKYLDLARKVFGSVGYIRDVGFKE